MFWMKTFGVLFNNYRTVPQTAVLFVILAFAALGIGPLRHAAQQIENRMPSTVSLQLNGVSNT